MVTLIASFSLFTGVLATFIYAKNRSSQVQSINYFILGLVTLLLGVELYGTVQEEKTSFLPYLLLSILTIHFLLGEITKRKTAVYYAIIPVLFAPLFLILPDLSGQSYSGYQLEGGAELVLIATISAITPFLTYLAKLGITNLIIRFGNIKWADNEENYLESLVSYAFVGGIAALGNFLLGPLGLVIAATFYLSASLIAKNKLGLKNDIFLSASGALFLLVTVPIVLKLGGFESLNLVRGEVIEGAFVGGFIIISHELFLRLARFNSGSWKWILTSIGILLPLLSIVVLGFAYTAFERLGGVLTLAAVLSSMAILSIAFALIKNSSYVNLKLITIGASLLILPFIKPVEQTSTIDLASLGIDTEATEDSSTKSEPSGKDLGTAIGNWVIDSENAKVFFELGPEDGRTKGEFKTLSGKLAVNEDLSNSYLEVTLPLDALTTYIGPRDQELMGEDYFNAEKYPTITFKSNSFSSKEDYYEVNGKFTMMGVTKTLPIKLKLIGKGEKDGKQILVISGVSEVDRTEFGMSPSSKIGNVVDFHYEVQLEEMK